MILLLLGGPATGKGTVSKILKNHFNVPHISTGDLLRESTDPKIHELMTSGQLIDDDTVSDLLYKRLIEADCENGFIIDGYPRTLRQAVLLDEIMKNLKKSIDVIIELTVPKQLVYNRILDRKSCTQCGKIYGNMNKPVDENHCDDCGGDLVKRSDDTKETLDKRIQIYSDNVDRIKYYYKHFGIWKTYDNSSKPEKILNIFKPEDRRYKKIWTIVKEGSNEDE